MYRRRGFSLIEFVVAVVILVVLAAIGTFTYRAIINKSANVSAESSIGRVEQSELGFATSFGFFTPDPTDLQPAPGNDITLTTGNSTGPSVVSIAVGTDGSLGIAALSTSGSCETENVADASSGQQPTLTTLASSAACSGASALASGIGAVSPTSVRPT
jgi:prepilin-type N-terminal cleavage/methylation domain-containing protein